jgi:hypothetical protein
MIWPTDPKTKEASVSLGILVVATACMVVATILSVTGYAKSTDLVVEFWLGAAGLYWGRKFTSSKGSGIAEAIETVAKDLEQGDQKQ